MAATPSAHGDSPLTQAADAADNEQRTLSPLAAEEEDEEEGEEDGRSEQEYSLAEEDEVADEGKGEDEPLEGLSLVRQGSSVLSNRRPPVAEEDEDAEGAGGESAEEEPLEELSQARHVFWEDGFLPEAPQLRALFDDRFRDPRTMAEERFMWDYWHIPDQYTLVRTQAQVYFPAPLYEALENALLTYGESRLGCPSISTIWMSYYVDGCSQELHCDNPQGPFAFVLSLTEWDTREFKGGETMIMRPEVLDYWSHFDPKVGQEMTSLFTTIEPLFNRLTIFDPRFPHGVRPVTGTKDPRKARLVLHGWFTLPSPFFAGGLTAAQAEPSLNEALEVLYEDLADETPATGTLILRLDISGAGTVTGMEFLADTLVPLGPRGDAETRKARAQVQHLVQYAMEGAQFPAADNGEDSQITLPIIFE